MLVQLCVFKGRKSFYRRALSKGVLQCLHVNLISIAVSVLKLLCSS